MVEIVRQRVGQRASAWRIRKEVGWAVRKGGREVMRRDMHVVRIVGGSWRWILRWRASAGALETVVRPQYS